MPAEEKPELAALNWSAPPVSHDIEEDINQDIAHDDKTTSVLEQAKANGWKCEYYSFGTLDGKGTEFFNPGIIQRPDGLWLLTRASGLHPEGFMYGQNSIIAFKLDDHGKQPCYGKVLNWPEGQTVVNQHFEDPRGLYHPAIGQTLIGCCTFTWDGPGNWSGPHQAFGAFDEEWNCKKMDYPLIGGNPGTMEKIKAHKDYEKNWLWFLHEGNLILLYKANPWTVYMFGNRWSEQEKKQLPGVTWQYGEIRGGTTPVLVGDYYFTFHHSSLPWKGRYRRYYAGCLAFDAKPPFTPRLITSEPILIGSQNDTWAQRKPLVVFPCGAVYKDETWLVTLGVNDMVSAWLELPHRDLFGRMKPVEQVADPIFKDYGLPKDKKLVTVVTKEMKISKVETEEDKKFILGEIDRLKREKPKNWKSSCWSLIRKISWSELERREVYQSIRERKGRKEFSPEALQNLRNAAAKARAARVAKRAEVLEKLKDVPPDQYVAALLDLRNPPNGEPPLPKRRRKRRRRRTKAQMIEARQKALADFEASKTESS